MKTYFKSEDGKFYESQEDCVKADKEFNKKNSEIAKMREDRSKRSKEIEEAENNYLRISKEVESNIQNAVYTYRDIEKKELERLNDAKKKYNKLMVSFLKDYGSYHKSFTSDKPRIIDLDFNNVFSFFNLL